MVEPCLESLNNSDCFILTASNRLFLLIGEYANIIEKSKANEIYDWIRLKKDLGLKTQTTCSVINSRSLLFEDENNLSHAEKEFIKLLKKNSTNSLPSSFQNLQPSDEDEKYELLTNDTNMVFKVMKLNETDDDRCVNYNDENTEESKLTDYCLQPIDDYWGRILSYNMLDENDVFVFDFGSEVYIWSGRNAKRLVKKSGLLLAKKLFESGYDYTNCKFSPLKPNLNEDETNIYYKCNGKRPKWTLFGRQKQNAETCLFRSKF